MLKLHYAPGTISVVVAITLEELGIDYTAAHVDFANAAQTRPAHLALNPKGRVPVLETPDGILTETGAILDYIGAGSPLIPDTPFAAAKMREVMYYLASTMHVNHAHKMRGHRWADQQASFDDMTAKVPQTMAASCAYLESNFPLAPFVTGTTMTLADPYLTVILGWCAGDGVDLAGYPKLAAYLAMMRARPCMQSVTAKGMLT